MPFLPYISSISLVPGLHPWVSVRSSRVPPPQLVLKPRTLAGKYHWTKGRIAMGVLVQFASVVAFTGWGLYLWIHVDNYGYPSGCNDRIKYVVLFFTVRATAPWLRGIWIAAIVLSAVGLMIQFVIQATLLFAGRYAGEGEQEGETNSITRRSTRTGAQSIAETEMRVPKPWYLAISYPLLLCVLYLSSLI